MANVHAEAKDPPQQWSLCACAKTNSDIRRLSGQAMDRLNANLAQAHSQGSLKE
jgi:hypothetical protein